jgi:hypothetical protein
LQLYSISHQFQTQAKIRSSSVSLNNLPQLTNFQNHYNTYLLQHKSATPFTKQKLLFTYKISSIHTEVHTAQTCYSNKTGTESPSLYIAKSFITSQDAEPRPKAEQQPSTASMLCRPREKFAQRNLTQNADKLSHSTVRMTETNTCTLPINIFQTKYKLDKKKLQKHNKIKFHRLNHLLNF